MTTARAGADRGSASVTVVGALAIAIAFGWGIARLGGTLVQSARAQSIADAVALAIAADASGVSSNSVIVANRADVESVFRNDTWVDVVVGVEGVRARARASIALP